MRESAKEWAKRQFEERPPNPPTPEQESIVDAFMKMKRRPESEKRAG